MFWGLSEALDFVEEYLKYSDSSTQSVNVLLFGSCDPRHIIKTAAKSYKHNVQVNFYVVDGCVEIIARNIALLAIALESSDLLSASQKTHLFMDIYGNSLLRPASHLYLSSKVKTLINICTDEEIKERLAPAISIENLKYRERDGLENAFSFWLPKPDNEFDIQKSWEQRNRALLKTRYDHREGAFDWDLQMCLKDRGAKQICSQEYKTWRNTGVAFSYPEYEQCKTNKTLAAGLSRIGRKCYNRGYVGDIEVGPFCAFGLISSESSMHVSNHGQNDYRATDVTERNLLELFHELKNKTEYTHDKSLSRRYGCVVLQESTLLTGHDNESVDVTSYDDPMIEIPNIKIFFLSSDEVFGLQTSDKWTNFFDMVFTAQNYFQFLKEGFINNFRNNALVYFETNLYTVCKKEIHQDFEEKIKNYGKSNQLECLTNFGINVKYSIFRYKFNKSINNEE